jgi:T5SS/PEP-CTERM-associated repeat protein/autotransporter-associated beta strand protein
MTRVLLALAGALTVSVAAARPALAQASGSGGGGGSHGWVKPTAGGAGATSQDPAYGGGGGGGGGPGHASAGQSTGGAGGTNGKHFGGGGGGAPGVIGFDGRTSVLSFGSGSWTGTDGTAGGPGTTAPDNTSNPLANGTDGSSGGGGGGGAVGAFLPASGSAYVTGSGVTIKGGSGGNGGVGGGGGSTDAVSHSGGSAGGGGGGGGGAAGVLLSGGSLEIGANAVIIGGNGGHGGDGGTGAVGGPGGITQVCSDTGCRVIGLPGGEGGQGGGAGSGGAGGAGIYGGASSHIVVDANAVVRGGDGGDGGVGGATGYNPDDDNVSGRSGDGGNGGNGGAGVYLDAGATLQVESGAVITGGKAGKGGGSAVINLGGAEPGRSGQDGRAGAGVYSASNGNVIVGGTIEGGLNVDGSRANAIVFAGDNNRLEILTNYVLNGDVLVSGASNTLALGGNLAGNFDLSSFDGAFQGFNRFEKTGTSIWSITGSNATTLDSVRVDGGTLALTGSGTTLKSTDAVIGGAAGSNGAVTIDGARWYNWYPIKIGDQGTGSLTISNGGTLAGTIDLVPVFGSLIGNAPGSHGSVVITDPGSSWSNYSALMIGNKGTGSLTISNGGRLDSYSVVGIGGAEPGASGSVTVTGAGSYWNTHLIPENSPANILGVGGPGGGSLTISAGGKIDSGTTSFVNADAVVTGNNSVLNTSSYGGLPSLQLHSDASLPSTTLTIADGAVVNTGGAPTQIDGAGSQLSIGAQAGDAAVAPGTLTTSSILFSHGGTLNFNHTATDYTFSAAMSGAGAINFLAGTTILTGNSAGFSGSTIVSDSTLRLADKGSLGGTLAINNGGQVEGYGTVGPTTVNSGGMLAPDGILPLTVTGNLTVNGGGTVVSDSGALHVGGDMLLESTSTFDYSFGAAAIQVSGDLTLNGAALNINNDGTPRFGTYSLITYDGALTNDNLLPDPTPPTTPIATVFTISTSTPHAVNLVAIPNGIDIFQTWGGGTDGTGQGDGTWNAANANWLDPIGGFTPTTWGSGYGTFGGPGGTVTIEGQQSSVGLEFTNGDYTLAAGAGGSLLLNRYDSPDFTIAVPELRVLPNITATISATIEGVDGLRKSGDGTLILSGANTYSGGTIISGGTLQVSSDTNLGDAGGALTFDTGIGTLHTTQTMSSGRAINLVDSAIFETATGTTFNASGTITGAGALIKTGEGTLELSGNNGWLGGTLLAAGTLRSDATGALPFNTDYAITGGTLDLNNINLTMRSLWGSGGAIALGSAQLTVEQATDSFFAGTISGTGGLTKDGAGTLLLSGNNTYHGGTTIEGGALAITSDANLGDAGGAINFLGGRLTTFGNIVTGRAIGVGGSGTIDIWSGTTLTATNAITGSGTFMKDGGGTLVLTGNSSFSGATDVNNGTLTVNGSLALSSLTTVNAGAWLTGTGVVGATAINGGVLAPGDPVGRLTVQGSLTMTAASTYMMQVSLANDLVHVTGAANLGGAAVNATFLEGSYVKQRYTILTADGGLGGSTFSHSSVAGLPASFTSKLSYDANNAYLLLAMTTPKGLSINQRNVSDALVGVFNSDGGIPQAFAGLSPAGLTQVSGELATGAQQASINAANLFLGMMGDPSLAGRGNIPPPPAGNASAYAPAATGYPAARDAFASIDRKAGARTASPTFDQRWSVWASGFGGTQTTSGNAMVGSGTATSNIYGAIVGADYRVSPDTLVGFAMAGGGTSFRVADALGSGHSDLFQAGVFLRHAMGPAYLSGALAYGWQDITSDRTVTLAGTDRLRANFNANTFSGRVEAGYRVATHAMGITPYAAGQIIHLALPSYAEQAIAGSNIYALSYDAKHATMARTELGARADRSFALDESILILRGRAAWAHDFNSDRSVAATFQTLPGASFVVNGAMPSHDALLAGASAGLKWLNGVSVAVSFDGEFSATTASYAGKGLLRYQW